MTPIGRPNGTPSRDNCQLAMEFREETELKRGQYVIVLENAIDSALEGAPRVEFIKNRDVSETPFGGLKDKIGTGSTNNFIYNIILPDFVTFEQIKEVEESYAAYKIREDRMQDEDNNKTTDINDIFDYIESEKERLSDDGYMQMFLNHQITCFRPNDYRTNTMSDLVIEIALTNRSDTDELFDTMSGSFGIKNKLEFVREGRRVQIKPLSTEDPVKTDMIQFNGMMETWEIYMLEQALQEEFSIENIIIREGKLDR